MRFVRWGWVVALALAAAACGCKSGKESASARSPREARCDAPELKARYEACRATADEQACKAAGGEWRSMGMLPTPTCVCPTGQDGCPCQSSEECLAGCYAPLRSSAQPQDRCKGVTEGLCGADSSAGRGCICEFLRPGNVDGRCAD
jgi:hypothetical protein